MAIHLCVCFCWALPRFFVVLLLFLRRNADLAGGFAGRWFCAVWVFCVMIGFAIYGPLVLFTQFFTAYAIVRTEPSAFSATPEEKKSLLIVWRRFRVQPPEQFVCVTG